MRLHPERDLTSLDPRAPLVLDTRELGRRPGSQLEKQLTVSAPADLGIEVLRVPEGSPVRLDLRLEAVMEGVLVTGEALAELEGECARCLVELEDDVRVPFQELFVYADKHARAEEHSREGEDPDLDDETRVSETTGQAAHYDLDWMAGAIGHHIHDPYALYEKAAS